MPNPDRDGPAMQRCRAGWPVTLPGTNEGVLRCPACRHASLVYVSKRRSCGCRTTTSGCECAYRHATNYAAALPRDPLMATSDDIYWMFARGRTIMECLADIEAANDAPVPELGGLSNRQMLGGGL